MTSATSGSQSLTMEAPTCKRRPLCEDLLDPDRIAALQECDQQLLSYDSKSFWLIFRLRGRNFGMITLPLTTLLLWDMFWGLLLLTAKDPWGVTPYIQSMENLITPVLMPVSFLMVFRLGRAAVRYWDARSAVGKMVEICRTTASSALIGCRRPTNHESGTPVEVEASKSKKRQQELAEDIIRWIAVFPLAVKNFLRPWEHACNRSREVGEVLSLEDRDAFLNAKGDALFAPILVLNQIRQLSYQMVYFNMDKSSPSNSITEAVIAGTLFRQLNEEIDILTGAWGAMERINATPLPFVYVVHLRTFLLLYLLLWHVEAIASSGWIAILPLQLASWGLLGIEAAAVECERPFQRNSNHLALGKAGIVVARNLAQTWQNLG
ncbi:bestrophin, RFP-TM, chloride channel [Nitzschia inconspicua]|uniref:Bestrophin, RFP-TM, chloride channel n=1 Tax=Nitzschia inconspicua TaxID=303405 RepID=A0A9K3PDW7_9STRA|nr:bestrophin, RFP-TM, chloride channel [Nitzschia inconspicua]